MQCNNADLTSESDSSLSVSNASNWTCDNIEPQLPMSRQGYAGDRYIPMRRGYSFEAAYHLLKKNTQLLENDTIIKRDHNSVTIDIRKQVSRYDIKHYSFMHAHSHLYNHVLRKTGQRAETYAPIQSYACGIESVFPIR